MDRLAGQFKTQGAVDQLMLAHPVEAGEGGGHHLYLEMVPAAGEILDLDGGIGQGATDGVPDLIRLNHDAARRQGEAGI